jgi:hypothetical protein
LLLTPPLLPRKYTVPMMTHAQTPTPVPTISACSFDSTLSCGATSALTTLEGRGNFLDSFPGAEANFRLSVPTSAGLSLTLTTCADGTTAQTAVHLYQARRPAGCPSLVSKKLGNATLLASSGGDDTFVCGTLFYDLDPAVVNVSSLVVVVEGLREADDSKSFALSVECEAFPTPRPTSVPLPLPSPLPTSEPTERPTPAPSVLPTNVPSPRPTPEPTPQPSQVPTSRPTSQPAPLPSVLPTQEPTHVPSPLPAPFTAPSQLSAAATHITLMAAAVWKLSRPDPAPYQAFSRTGTGL